jgi:hypothetical protein
MTISSCSKLRQVCIRCKSRNFDVVCCRPAFVSAKWSIRIRTVPVARPVAEVVTGHLLCHFAPFTILFLVFKPLLFYLACISVQLCTFISPDRTEGTWGRRIVNYLPWCYFVTEAAFRGPANQNKVASISKRLNDSAPLTNEPRTRQPAVRS